MNAAKAQDGVRYAQAHKAHDAALARFVASTYVLDDAPKGTAGHAAAVAEYRAAGEAVSAAHAALQAVLLARYW